MVETQTPEKYDGEKNEKETRNTNTATDDILLWSSVCKEKNRHPRSMVKIIAEKSQKWKSGSGRSRGRMEAAGNAQTLDQPAKTEAET